MNSAATTGAASASSATAAPVTHGDHEAVHADRAEQADQADQADQATQAFHAAMAAFRANQLDTAIAHAQAALQSDTPALRADAATLLARIARRQGRLDDVLTDVGRALEAARAAGDTVRECRARAQHAHALNALGLMEAALEESYATLRLAELTGDAASEAAGCEALAAVQWSMSHWADAVDTFQRMLDKAVEAADVELQMVARGGLAGSESALAQTSRTELPATRLRRSEAHGLDYLRLATELQDVHSMRAARHNRATLMVAMGQRVAARAALVDLLAEADTAETRAMALMNLADLDMQEQDPASAASRLQEAHIVLEAAGERGYLSNCCDLLTLAHEALGDFAAALHWHRQYHDLHVRQSSDRAQVHARALAVKHKTDQAEASAAFERMRAQRFERAALEDSLTGLANRRAFDHTLANALDAAVAGRPFGLALLDLDHFKQINDRHSHLVGDEVLRRVAKVLAATSRQADLAARYGGEEFALVLTAADAGAVRQACERVRVAVEAMDWTDIAPGLVARISVGCVHVDAATAGMGADALLALADKRLYAAKAGGRNRVVADDVGC